MFRGLSTIISALIISAGLVTSVWLYGAGDRAERIEAARISLQLETELAMEQRVDYVKGHVRDCLAIHASRHLESDGEEDVDLAFGLTADVAMWYAMTGEKNPYSTLELKPDVVVAIRSQCYTAHYHDEYYDDVREYMLTQYGRVDYEEDSDLD